MASVYGRIILSVIKLSFLILEGTSAIKEIRLLYKVLTFVYTNRK